MLAFNQAFLGGQFQLFGYWIRVLGLFLKWGLKGSIKAYKRL
ncbi:membrane protein [Helicobacter pylori UM067]|nr:membrane protein [Helicobacter pylori UM067]